MLRSSVDLPHVSLTHSDGGRTNINYSHLPVISLVEQSPASSKVSTIATEISGVSSSVSCSDTEKVSSSDQIRSVLMTNFSLQTSLSTQVTSVESSISRISEALTAVQEQLESKKMSDFIQHSLNQLRLRSSDWVKSLHWFHRQCHRCGSGTEEMAHQDKLKENNRSTSTPCMYNLLHWRRTWEN